MPRLAVVTPSYAPDFELCADLTRSVLAMSPPDVRHHIIVPARDEVLFRRLAGDRVEIHLTRDYLPRTLVKVPGANFHVNARRPVPPLRGWITQQIVKLAVSEGIDADVALLVDSDTVFVRPFSADTYVRDGVVRFYRVADGVHEGMPRHVLWHHAARKLLGLPPADPPFADYICIPCAWSPAIVAGTLDRIAEVSGRPWQTAVGGELNVSEMILYGVYVEHVLGLPAFTSDDMLCHNHYDENAPMDEPALHLFLNGLGPDDNAVMISAKSGTPLGVRRAVLASRSASAQ